MRVDGLDALDDVVDEAEAVVVGRVGGERGRKGIGHLGGGRVCGVREKKLTMMQPWLCLAPLHVHVYRHSASPSPASGVAVFLHGFGMHARADRYAPLYASLLSRSLAVVAWDMPAHGCSSRLCASSSCASPLRHLHVREP